MGKGIDLLNKTIEVLQEKPDERFTARKIAEEIYSKYPEACDEKQERSKAISRPIKDDNKELIRQIAAEISRDREILQSKYPQLKVTDGRPREYYYTESPDDEGTEQSEDAPTAPPVKDVSEVELYTNLGKFLESEFNIYSKRIDEKTSSKGQRGDNKWLHPDVVAVEVLSQNWDSEITKCVGEYGDKKAKLWSFEVKAQVSRSKLREFFFQAVSNSSWANYGYLVVSEIADNASNEMRILSGLHGIGLIVLNVDDPAEGRVLIPAREKQNIDWDAANRLTQVNSDFKEYIKLVTYFYKTDVINENDWKWDNV